MLGCVKDVQLWNNCPAREIKRILCWNCAEDKQNRNNCPKLQNVNKEKDGFTDGKLVCFDFVRQTFSEIQTPDLKVEFGHHEANQHVNEEDFSRKPRNENWRNCLKTGKKYEMINPTVRQIKVSAMSKPDPRSDGSFRKVHKDPDIKPLMGFNESSRRKLEWQNVSTSRSTTKRYWALWNSLHTENGVLYMT